MRPLAALAVFCALSARAGNIELVPEIGLRGSAPAAAASAAFGAVPLQMAPNSLVALSLVVPAGATPLPAPTLALAPLAPLALVAPQSAAAKAAPIEGRPLLIKSLAAPALDASTLSAADAEKDFNARAQLDTPSAAGSGVLSAPSAAAPSKRSLLGRLKAWTKPAAPGAADAAALGGRDRSGALMKASLAALKGAPAGSILPLDFVPTEKSLRAISELPYEVFLHRRKSDGKWLMAGGDRHGVSGVWEDYDLALHNHPTARIGIHSMHSEYPSPEDLATAAGKDARFFVISEAGVVEWNANVPDRVESALSSNFFGRFVMRIAFPALYPTLLASRGVAARLQPWRKVTSEWLERGEAPTNERILIEKTIPAFIALEFPLIAAKLGRSVDAAYAADVLKRSNGYRMYWHSATTYKDHPDHLGIPDGHFRKDFGIRLMVKPDWRGIKDLSANFRPLFAHEYVHWLQNEGHVSNKWGAEIAAVAVEVLRAIELVGLEQVKAGRAATVHQGIISSFDGGRAWARSGFTNESAPYGKGALAGAAYEAGAATGRPEAAWEFLNLVIACKGALEPKDAWARVAGSK